MTSQGFSANPFDHRHSSLRAGTADRDEVTRILGEAYASGQLDDEEYQERLESALEIKVLGEIPSLLVELGDPAVLMHRPLAKAEVNKTLEHARKERTKAVLSSIGGFALATVVLNVVWLLTVIGGGEFIHYWPIWPMLAVIVGGAANIYAAQRKYKSHEAKVLDASKQRPQLGR